MEQQEAQTLVSGGGGPEARQFLSTTRKPRAQACDPSPTAYVTPVECKNVSSLAQERFFRKMKMESERLATFLTGLWCVPFVRPDDLAEAGFFYIPDQEIVQCSFCLGVISNWSQDDIPLVQHAKYYPQCPFVLGYDVGNIPIVRDAVRPHPSVSHSIDESFLGYETPMDCKTENENCCSALSKLSLKDYGVQLYRQPAYRNYITKEARLQSFKKTTRRLSYSAEEFSQSVFFIKHGLLICAFSGFTATPQEFKLSPWLKHARNQPRCYYVYINKGSEGQGFQENNYQPDVKDNKNKCQQYGQAEEIRANRPGSNPGNSTVDSLTCGEQEVILGMIKTSENVTSTSTPQPRKKTNRKGPQHFRAPTESDERLLCKVCLDANVGVVVLPCNHVVVCTLCAVTISGCPICRTKIRAFVKVLLS